MAVAHGASGVEEITRLCMLPLQPLHPDVDGEEARMCLVREQLAECQARGTLLEQGFVVYGLGGLRFAVVKCIPSRGIIGDGTRFFLNGPALPRLLKVKLVALTRHNRGVNCSSLLSKHVRPHFEQIFSDPNRCAVAIPGEMEVYDGVRFHTAVIVPDKTGIGVVDKSTKLVAALDAADEFVRIQVVPFDDTLPQAYDYNVFEDYVLPFFENHRLARFSVGDTFVHNSVQFKVVGAEPSACQLRVGRDTKIFFEGRMQPTAADLLTPAETAALALLPPEIQTLALQSEALEGGELAQRIMAAQAVGAGGAREAGVNRLVLDQLAAAELWSVAVAEREALESPQCTVCFGDFEFGESVRSLPCKHVFHMRCIDEWLRRDAHCPLCRTSFCNGI